MTLLLQTEDLVAERRSVRVADISAATQAALQQLERLQAVAAAIGAPTTGPPTAAATAPASAADPVDTADIQQQLLAASDAAAEADGNLLGGPAASGGSMLGPGAPAPFVLPIGDPSQMDVRTVPCDKATEILGVNPICTCQGRVC